MNREMGFQFFCVAALTGLGAMSAPIPPAETASWGEFARIGARGPRITIIIGTVSEGVASKPVYWAKRVGSTDEDTIDSNKCVALVAVVESTRQISLPKVAPGNPAITIADATMYSLTVPSSYYPPHSSNLDKLTVTAAGGPLANWVDNALKRLDGCWSSA